MIDLVSEAQAMAFRQAAIWHMGQQEIAMRASMIALERRDFFEHAKQEWCARLHADAAEAMRELAATKAAPERALECEEG